ncbi:MAG: DNA methyltransferase, partial [candidate division WOR-3 bacterium]|nr:DNA methyltransferase [candidate division WOR-3 bacterium]
MANNKEVIKDLDKVEPIDYVVVAKPHTPIYKMHRYFARRPYTVFNELIKHYSNPGSIILDPMCGGGVTIVEGLKLRRKVIGVDLNPMAIFITRCEVMDVDLDKLKKAFSEIRDKVKDEINSFYHTICPKCQKETPADWFEWSNVVECPYCKKEVVFAEAKKIKAGTYQCSHCKSPLKALNCKRKPDKIVRLKIRCDCGFKGEKKPDKYDFEKYNWIADNFDRIVKKKNVWYPKDKIEDLLKGWKPEKNRLIKRGIRYFYELFNKRELLIWSTLLSKINNVTDGNIRYLLKLLFSESIRFSCKFCYRKKSQPVGWGAHGYWPPDIRVEVNILNILNNRFGAILKGK